MTILSEINVEVAKVAHLMSLKCLIVVIIAFFSASLSIFLKMTFYQGMIFRRYYLWLIMWWQRSWKKKDRWRRFLLKPIGLCIFCYSAWVYIISGIIFYLINGMQLDIYYLFGIGINYIFVLLFLTNDKKVFDE